MNFFDMLPPTNGYFESVRIERRIGKSPLEYYQCKYLAEKCAATKILGTEAVFGYMVCEWDKMKKEDQLPYVTQFENKENCTPIRATVDRFQFINENKELRVKHIGYEFFACDGTDIEKCPYSKFKFEFPDRSFPVTSHHDQLIFATTLKDDMDKKWKTHYVGHYDGIKLYLSSGKLVNEFTFVPERDRVVSN